jgi:outer membrane protein assembly factor BamA
MLQFTEILPKTLRVKYNDVITRRLGESAKPGDVIGEQGVTLTVRRVRRGRVFEAVATSLPPERGKEQHQHGEHLQTAD